MLFPIKIWGDGARYDVQQVMSALDEPPSIEYAYVPADTTPKLQIDDRLYEGMPAMLRAIRRYRAAHSTACVDETEE